MDNVFSRPYLHTDILGQQIVRDRALPWRQDFKARFLLIMAVVSCALLLVWFRVETVQIGYEISHANTVYHELTKENHRLRVEKVSLKSPSRIEKIAKVHLGLNHPKPEQIITLP